MLLGLAAAVEAGLELPLHAVDHEDRGVRLGTRREGCGRGVFRRWGEWIGRVFFWVVIGGSDGGFVYGGYGGYDRKGG